MYSDALLAAHPGVEAREAMLVTRSDREAAKPDPITLQRTAVMVTPLENGFDPPAPRLTAAMGADAALAIMKYKGDKYAELGFPKLNETVMVWQLKRLECR